MYHTCFGCCQSAVVLEACAFHLRTLSVSREPYVFPLTIVYHYVEFHIFFSHYNFMFSVSLQGYVWKKKSQTQYVMKTSCILWLTNFLRVCLLLPCDHLLGKGWPLGSRLWCLTVSLLLSHWYPGSGVVLDCIDSGSLHSFLLSYALTHSNRCFIIFPTAFLCVHLVYFPNILTRIPYMCSIILMFYP